MYSSPSHSNTLFYSGVYIVPISLVNEHLMTHCRPPVPEISQSKAFSTFNYESDNERGKIVYFKWNSSTSN